ncbi:MAG: TOBE domain-containing protein, partial [Bdellovibrionota bacterium]
ISTCATLTREGRGTARAFVRPERLRVLANGAKASPDFNSVDGDVVSVVFRGVRTEVLVSLASGERVRALGDVELCSVLQSGDRITLEFSPDETHLFFEGSR